MKQVPETTEEVRQRILREAAAVAEKAEQVSENTTEGMEVSSLDDTVKTDAAAEEKPIVHLFENFKIIYVLTLRLSSNFDDLKHQNVIVLSIFRILKQVPETTEEVRQRILREAAAVAEKAEQVSENTTEGMEVINLDDTVKTDAAAEEKPIVYLFENLRFDNVYLVISTIWGV